MSTNERTEKAVVAQGENNTAIVTADVGVTDCCGGRSLGERAVVVRDVDDAAAELVVHGVGQEIDVRLDDDTAGELVALLTDDDE